MYTENSPTLFSPSVDFLFQAGAIPSDVPRHATNQSPT